VTYRQKLHDERGQLRGISFEMVELIVEEHVKGMDQVLRRVYEWIVKQLFGRLHMELGHVVFHFAVEPGPMLFDFRAIACG
jgi:hypothetical protein